MIRAKWILFIIIGVIVLGTLNSSIVSSMELKNGEMQKAYLQSLEKELRTSLRKELDDRGYINDIGKHFHVTRYLQLLSEVQF